MGFKNLIEVDVNMVDLINREAETSQLGINIDKKEVHSCDTTLLKYDHEHLISIGKQVKDDKRLKILDCKVVKTLDSKEHCMVVLKLKFVRNCASLDVTNNTQETVIFEPKTDVRYLRSKVFRLL